MTGRIDYKAKTREAYYRKIEKYLLLCRESRQMGQIYNCLEDGEDLSPRLKNIYKEIFNNDHYHLVKAWHDCEDSLDLKLTSAVRVGRKLGLKISDFDFWEFEGFAQNFQEENDFCDRVIEKVRELKQAKTMYKGEKPALAQPILGLRDLVQWYKETS